MAYRINATANAFEFRGLEMRQSKKTDKTFLLMHFEDSDGHSNDVSCSDSSLFNDCNSLKKGDICDLPLCFVATSDYSFVNLVAPPVVHGNAYTGIGE